uniref:TIR domain-containing protein n=1 Tax=Strigamia maritima TaxID=126957 RepID=T1IK31_STRMM
MFSKGICLRLVCEEDIDADKVYDAFVSYSSEDEDWITDFLVPGLETGNPTYNLCLHNRDWLGGEFITDQIVKSVKSSRRTIIVLTDNYLKSKWSRLEFDVAYQQGLKDQVRRVMVIIPDEVPDLSQIDPEFKTFITLTTYIQANKPHFWRTLRASMPRTKNICKPSTSTRRTVVTGAVCTVPTWGNKGTALDAFLSRGQHQPPPATHMSIPPVCANPTRGPWRLNQGPRGQNNNNHAATHRYGLAATVLAHGGGAQRTGDPGFIVETRELAELGQCMSALVAGSLPTAVPGSALPLPAFLS